MNHYNLHWLQELFSKGEKVDLLFFWGHTNNANESIGKFIFSQWYPSPFTVDNTLYKTAEHWMMAEKARLFNDHNVAQKIISTDTPKEAKALGRQVEGFDALAWEKNCFSIVVEGNKHKFIQNKGFKEYLLATGDKVIVEASPVDTIWGIGLTQESVQSKNPLNWRGQNLLGFALMMVRDILKD